MARQRASRCVTAVPRNRASSVVSAAFHVLSSAKRTRTPTRDAVAGRRAVRVRASGSDSEATPGTAQREVSIGDGGLDETADGEDDEMLGDIEIPELPKHWMIHDSFLPTHGVGSASSLRGVFDTHHDDPRRTHEYRFVWDYWHVPGQYTLLRTPAGDYFPAADFQQLEFALQKYARAELGCAATTPIWLSCYVEGMRQELHADVPHGPWAFVLSLTNWETRTWSGGETLLLRPETLSYFSNFDSDAVVERGSLTETIEPKFNRLTVFDPRVPHGVPIVEGIRDPKKGRLVLHGWFREPAPFLAGVLAGDDDDDETASSLLSKQEKEDRKNLVFAALENEILPPLYGILGQLPRARGTVVCQVFIAPDGRVEKTKWSADSLVPVAAENATETRDAILGEIAATFLSLREETFPRSEGDSTLTVPFMFD